MNRDLTKERTSNPMADRWEGPLSPRWRAWIGLALLGMVPEVARAQVSGAMDIWPRNATVEVGSTRQFGAYVPISPNSIVWLINEIPGGNATLGTISASGRYTAPAVAPVQNVITIKARSTAYPSSFAETPVTITRKYPWLWSVSPSTFPAGGYQISLNGANFTSDSKVLADGMEIATTYVSSTRLLASGVASQAGTIQFSVRQPAPGSVIGNTAKATVSQPVVTVVVSVTPTTASVQLGSTRTFQATVTGSANTAVTWSVGGVPGGSPVLGTISPGGLYTAPATLPPSGSVPVRATSVASPTAFATATVTLTEPPPVVPPVDPPEPPPSNPSSAGLLAAGRFLEQSSFGPTPATLAEVEEVGVTAYLDSQLALPESPIPSPSGNSMGALRQWALHHYTTAPDQLRQRVAYSLSQILVTSGTKLVYADEMLPWLRLLSRHAFGNYRDLLRDVTISPSMGKFLDLANSTKPGVAGGANENYPRELLQLFSIGLWQLNPDGSRVLDGAGQPVPAYTQETVTQVALALTGWTYPTAPGATPRDRNWEWFGAPMEPRPQNHATTAKTFLGCNLPAGQTVEQDLDGVVDCLMRHPNTAPFVAVRLIRSLVMSNPSPGYVQRVAAVFADNGQGVRGDLKAVIRAILLDAEARNDTATVHQGRLKEPILQISGFLRALNGSFSSTQQLTYLFDYMGQSVLSPPSVFSWFSPLYRLPGNAALAGPEFQIYTPTEATLRGNMIYSIINYPGSDVPVDLSPFQPLGNDIPALVDKANAVLLYGRLPAGVRQAIITAASPGYDAKTRIETVLYLTALTGQYAVQH
ncbi:MAG: DUF1800 family protein [Limisphaerales bacterium]